VTSGNSIPSSTPSLDQQAAIDGESTSTVGIENATFDVEVASTMIQQANGLSYRASLAPNDGMLFLFSSSSVQNFWMKDMNFALDMIWIGPAASGTGSQVVGFAQDVPAPAPGTALWSLTIYSSPGNTNKVLEVNAGTVAKYNIKVGDPVEIGQIH